MSNTNRWLKILNAEFFQTSDRACAIVAAALLEQLLHDLLHAHLVPNPSSNDTLFDGPSAPIGSFATKIDFAYRLGLISARLTRDLHLVRKIRNLFAHELEGCTFDRTNVANQVAELLKSLDIESRCPSLLGPPYNTIRGHFMMSVTLIIGFLDELVERGVVSLQAHADDDVYTNQLVDESRTLQKGGL